MMPLFSSKFAFKKSTSRRRQSLPSDSLSKNKPSPNGQFDSNSDSSDSSDDDRSLAIQAKNVPKKAKCRNEKDSSAKELQANGTVPSILIQTKSPKSRRKEQTTANSKIIFNDKSKRKKKNRDEINIEDKENLVLYLDRERKFSFDYKHGTWLGDDLLLERSRSKPNLNSIEFGENSGHTGQENVVELMDTIKNLKEENRLLKLKIEILIEMVTETTAELNLKEK